MASVAITSSWARVDDGLSLSDGSTYLLQATVQAYVAEGSTVPTNDDDALLDLVQPER